MSKTYRRVLATLLLGAVVVFVVSRAQAADEQKVADRIASFIQDRLVIADSIVYRAASVTTAIDTGGRLYLHVDADPLYRLESRDGARRARGHHDYAVPANAKCGELEASRSIESTSIAVREGSLFIDLRDALRGVMDELPAFPSRATLIEIDSADLHKIRGCARTVAAKARAVPFEAIHVYSRKILLTKVERTVRKSSVYEYNLEEDAPVTQIVVTPKPDRDAADFSVEVRAVSVMQCDYEGPHLELDDWKKGLSTANTLPRKGEIFSVGTGVLQSETPKFPAYTQAELRRAINVQARNEGLASVEDAQPCAPFLRGHRFFVRHQGRVVHEVSLYVPGGC